MRKDFKRENKSSMELVIGFKQIYVNKYSFIVINLDTDPKTIIFQHQSFHIWETHIRGLLLSESNDFLTLSKEGIMALSLYKKKKEKEFRDPNNPSIMRKLHSLQECNYLKVQDSNMLLFKYNLVDNKNNIIIKILEHYSNRSNDTEF